MEEGRNTRAYRGLRPFVRGRGDHPTPPVSVRSRPFPGTRAPSATDGPGATAQAPLDPPQWNIAVYERGPSANTPIYEPPVLFPMPAPLDEPFPREGAPPAIEAPPTVVPSSCLEAADVLEAVAERLRSGEIVLPAGISPRNEAAVVASVLSALLGERR